MKPVVIAMSIALALAAYWIEEFAPCFFEDGTDYCTGCIDDCLDPAEKE